MLKTKRTQALLRCALAAILVCGLTIPNWSSIALGEESLEKKTPPQRTN